MARRHQVIGGIVLACYGAGLAFAFVMCMALTMEVKALRSDLSLVEQDPLARWVVRVEKRDRAAPAHRAGP